MDHRQTKQLPTTDLLKHSVKLLNNYLSVYRQEGLVVTGKEKVTLPGVLSEGSFDVKNMVSRDQLETVAAFYLMALKELWMNCDNTFTNESITSCSLMLINRYEHWHPKELIIVLRNGLAGNYGKAYGKINTDKVMAWAKEYDEVERAKYFENKDKNGSHEIGWNEMDAGMLKEIFKPEDKKAVDAYTKPAYILREKTDQEKMIQKWMVDFDELHKKQTLGKLESDFRSLRFVEIMDFEQGQLTLDAEEYLVYRLKQISK